MPDADGLRLRAIRYLAMALKAREDGDADFASCLAKRATELSEQATALANCSTPKLSRLRRELIPHFVSNTDWLTKLWLQMTMTLPAYIIEECNMKTLAALLVLSALGITDASAQVPFLSGQYQCVQNCQGPGLAFVTQNNWNLNLVNEVGEPSRAWIDYPGHIWAQYWNEGAVYSPDGLTIQFDNGAVWHQFVPPPPVLRSRG